MKLQPIVKSEEVDNFSINSYRKQRETVKKYLSLTNLAYTYEESKVLKLGKFLS